MFSVAIPAFNRVEELRRALGSLKEQTYKDFEVIVCDDGSSEDIYSAIKEFLKDLSIVYFKIDPSGSPARPRTECIYRATKRWICFLDSDDWWTANKLEKVAFEIERQSGTDIFYHRLSQKGAGRKSLTNKISRIGSRIGEDPLAHLLCYGNVVPTSGAIIRASLAKKLGAQREDLKNNQDFEFWLRAASHGARFHFIPLSLGTYWLGSDGISVNPVRKNREITQLYSEYIEKLEEARRSCAMSTLAFMRGWSEYEAGEWKKAIQELNEAKLLPSWTLQIRKTLLTTVAHFKLHLLSKNQ